MEIKYAQLPNRVKAAVIDSIILIVLAYGVTEIFTLFDHIHKTIRIIAFLLIFVLYDPILTSSFGGTIGHSYGGILIKREREPNRNIGFPIAVVRFICKALLGWISLLTVTGNEKRKAIHDYIAGSIAISENK